ncbi:MAG: 4-oxalomesaconate tautomerase [Pseudomonadota bacterium]
MSKADCGIPCMWMRGGTSKGGFFLKSDLPQDETERNALLLAIMGSPDARQIDGMGGADPLTSKVAIVSKSKRPGIDIEYLFLQVFVDQPVVSDAQNCGNMLAAVGPFAMERGLISPQGEETHVAVYLENTGQTAIATLQTSDNALSYVGDTAIDGVPGTAAPVALEFQDTAGSMTGALMPTTNSVDTIDDVRVTLIDNGMPCIVIKATDVGVTGYETREQLDANSELKRRIEMIRLKAGPMMMLGDVTEKSVPKIMLIAPPRAGGALCVRSFIPHRAHASIGVLGAVTVATASLLPNSTAADIAVIPSGSPKTISIEHASGETSCRLGLNDDGSVASAAILRTARKLMDGRVFP